MSNWSEPTEIGMVIACDGVVTNLEFHSAGQYLAISTAQSVIHYVDCLKGVERKKVFAKQHGIGKIQFSHHEQCLLLSAGAQGAVDPCYDIKYLCLYDNRYLRFFKGHQSDITSLSMNPVIDQFLSSSYDNTVRLWDLNTPSCIGKLNLPFSSGPFNSQYSQTPVYKPPMCSYDATGQIFGVLHHSTLKLYDARNYEAGPFSNIFPQASSLKQAMLNSNENLTDAQINKYMNATWTGFEFSADAGNVVLVNTNTDAVLLLNGVSADNEPRVITSRKNEASKHTHHLPPITLPIINLLTHIYHTPQISCWARPSRPTLNTSSPAMTTARSNTMTARPSSSGIHSLVMSLQWVRSSVTRLMI